MTTRRLNIGIRSGLDRSKALRQAIRRAGHGDGKPQEAELYFESIAELREILTEKRLELLLAIARHRPASIHRLAALVYRDYKNVSTDVMLLQRLGLVDLQDNGGKGRAQAPTVPYDEIRVTIDLRQPQTINAA